MKIKRLILRPFAAFAVLLLVPASGFAESILLSAGKFTLFGGTGITSSGVAGTVIKNGNVGLSPGPTAGITGFPPAVIQNGAIIATGPVTAQARLDVIKAQVGLAGMAPNANMSTVDLGGKTLASGVYKFNSSASLNGALVLDGQGKNNAFWVFQIGTALTTAINSTVTIINPGSNGGRDYGIFWSCGSAINIGGSNQIAGNYLAGTSITFGSGSTRGGRALALAAVSLDDNQIDAFGGPGGSDWSGGLMFDRSGAVVPFARLSFRHFGKNHRTTQTAIRVIKGKASASATSIQWRTNNQKWHTVAIPTSGRWKVNARNFDLGNNMLRLRASAEGGERTAVQRLTIWRH
jgi:hypothetical protein